jgi:hypothetical protein
VSGTDIPSASPPGEPAGVPWSGPSRQRCLGPARREPGTTRLEARGRETRCGNRRRVAAPTDLRIEERSTARADRNPERPRGLGASRTPRKPERGAAGKPAATHARNALERGNPRGAASGRMANPRSIVTDSGGEQGPEAAFAKRPHVASVTSPSADNGKRAASVERRNGSVRRERLRRGEPHERYRPEKVGGTRETKRGKRVRNPAAAPEPGRGNSRVSGLPPPHAL